MTAARGPGWYARRLARMSAAEIATRVADTSRHVAWGALQVHPCELDTRPIVRPHSTRPVLLPPVPLPKGAEQRVPEAARVAVTAAADAILAGTWETLGVVRPDSADPDWFLDPVTGRRAPQDRYCFYVNHRDEAVVGNVKQVWELSRHHHLTVLAAAWWLTGDQRYAAAAASQLHSWMRANPYLSGIHWTSGIELGVRLVSWAWVRRLLDGWAPVRLFFEDSDLALRQLWWHQRWLSALRSTGSSGNNHLVAEQAGRLVAACAFPWFAESDAWRADAARRLARALQDNTFECGLNRELATDYHRFVTELGLVAAAEADAAGHPLDEATRSLLAASVDVAAALPDAIGRPPRQGDGDEGRALVLDGGGHEEAWGGLLAAGAVYAGPLPWWPATTPTVLSVAIEALGRSRPDPRRAGPRPTSRVRSPRPDTFPDAGLTLLRTDPAAGEPEIWVRCDGGPHGFGSMAAHAHADALSVEVRAGGVDVLADPGTYCYHGEGAWRSYFRSTAGHNTVEVDGQDQSTPGGPFLWSRSAGSTVDAVIRRDGAVRTWIAHHDGYPGVRHARSVTLSPEDRWLTLVDALTTRDGRPHRFRLMLHLGPDVRLLDATDSRSAALVWPGGQATLLLADGITWSAHRGEVDPPLGWYSPRFGAKVPTTVLVGAGVVHGACELTTSLAFATVRRAPAGSATSIHATSGGGRRT
ncbi:MULTISPECIES: alginate lyase family protein [Nocardioides]|uniref:Alginate lyase family protein n=1 Tax=Nocardioides vastitatis TaxID=2568655 RepID=A0ABW0ZIV1_9ACTN|nr:alginate lyase family protein [Nocardioides sp.]THI96659.1 heparinase [Nocardioides sp.]